MFIINLSLFGKKNENIIFTITYTDIVLVQIYLLHIFFFAGEGDTVLFNIFTLVFFKISC